jgi:hypothetical protein
MINLAAVFRHLDTQNNWKSGFDFISVYGSGWDLKTQDGVYNSRMTVYFLSHPPLSLTDVR